MPSLLLLLALGACTPQSATDTGETARPEDTAPPEDPWFTLVAIPDVQYLTLEPGYPMLREMMAWNLDHSDELNTAMVLQEGDLTHNNTEAEWTEADAAFAMLDGELPYAVCVGNHDMEGNDPATRDTSRFDQWFGLERWEGTATFLGSASETSAADHAHEFSAGGLDWLVLSLAYDPTDEALAWGAAQVQSHPEHRVIVLTHAYLTPSGNTGGPGQGVQEQIVDPHSNVLLVLNGHYIDGTSARRRRARDDGSEVVELFANYQDLPLAGSGRMRQMRINPSAGTLDVTSCNAFDHCSEEDGDQFSFDGLDFGL